jgi:phosphodiesterase/alkaline phosphatase D-like protein
MNHLQKAAPQALIAALAVAGLSASLFIPPFAHAATTTDDSPGLRLGMQFLKNKQQEEHHSVFDWIPPGLVSKIFDHWPGTAHDTDAPAISDVATQTHETSAAVSFSTDEKTRAIVFISTDSAVNENDADTLTETDSLGTDHSLSFTGLTADTQYYGRIVATDNAGNSSEESFSLMTDSTDTTDTTAPDIRMITTDVTATTTDVSWSTNEDADGVLYVSTTSPVAIGSSTRAASAMSLTRAHTLTADDLMPDTTYYAVLTSTDASGNVLQSDSFAFHTDAASDTTAPHLHAIRFDAGTSTLAVSWNTDEPTSADLYASGTSGFAIDDDGVMAAHDASLDASHALMLSGLSPDTNYFVRVHAADNAGNETTSAEFLLHTEAE